MILFGRDAGFTFIATEEIRGILEKMLHRRMILEFGIFRLQGTSKTFGFSKPDHPNGGGSRHCRDNTSYVLSICLLGLWFLEAKKSQAVVLCYAKDVQNRNQHAGGWSCTTLGWPLATYVDCCSDVMTADQMFIWHWDPKVGERRMKN